MAAGLPNSRRLRSGQLDALKASSLNLLQQQLFGPGGSGARTSGLLALIETPEAMAAYLLRAQGQDDLKRRARRCIEAAEEARRLAQARGWLAATQGQKRPAGEQFGERHRGSASTDSGPEQNRGPAHRGRSGRHVFHRQLDHT